MARSDLRTRFLLLTGIFLGWGALAAMACGGDDTGGGLRQRPPPGGGDGSVTDNLIVVPEGSVYDPETGKVMPIEEYLFRKFYPDLNDKCGSACHKLGTSPGQPPTWLKDPDPYVAIKAHPNAITRDPFLSVLVNKGQHAGPAVDLTDPDPKSFGKRFLEWLNAEAIALKNKPLPSTDPITVNIGANTVDISKGGTGVTGAQITFTAAVNGQLLSLTQIRLVSPATTGVHIVQPLFINVPPPPAAEEQDPTENFSNVDLTTNPGTTVQLGAGTAIFTGWKWNTANKLRIAFPKLEPGTLGDGGGVGGGCKQVAAFTTNAAPVLRGMGGVTPNCAGNCHGGQNAAATNALNLTSLTGANPDFTTACNQALTKCVLANKPTSPLLVRPSQAAHAGGVANPLATYQTAINAWLNLEN